MIYSTILVLLSCLAVYSRHYYGHYNTRAPYRRYIYSARSYYYTRNPHTIWRIPNYNTRSTRRSRGQWGDWGSWSRCDVPCGGGVQTRDRTCLGEGSSECYGRTEAKRRCNMVCCPVNGNWGLWSHWTTRRSHDYSYVLQRTRECNYPEPRCNGQLCYGEKVQTQDYERRFRSRTHLNQDDDK
ncbi:hypothetical protein EB796_012801 [Bugula neritina]|uniref:HMCN1 n=1 Tax=Bugula neritina TaxID=10212 RepID=A0A7J7JSL9_BUGNE|nr:hypothetical protein EB796_012801 [Bugula neritina]